MTTPELPGIADQARSARIEALRKRLRKLEQDRADDIDRLAEIKQGMAETMAEMTKVEVELAAYLRAAPPTWPEPMPIAEARPEMGRILVWDGEDWHKAKWFEEEWPEQNFMSFWWTDSCDNYSLARRHARKLTHFLPMPPAPGGERR